MHRIALVAALALVACGPKKKPNDVEPAAPDAAPAASTELPATLVDKIDRALSLMEQVAVVTEQNQSDCAAMATGLQALADGPDGTILPELDADPEYHQNADAVAQQYADRLGALGDRISVGIQVCNTRGVNDALTNLGLGGQ